MTDDNNPVEGEVPNSTNPIIHGKNGVVLFGDPPRAASPVISWEVSVPPVSFRRRPIRKVSALADISKDLSDSGLRNLVETRIQEALERKLGIDDDTLLNGTGKPEDLRLPPIGVSPLESAMIEAAKQREVELFLNGSWHNVLQYVQKPSSVLTLADWEAARGLFRQPYIPPRIEYRSEGRGSLFVKAMEALRFVATSGPFVSFRKPPLAQLAIRLRKSYPGLKKPQAQKLAQLVRRRAGVQ